MTLSQEVDDFIQWLNDRGESFDAARLKEVVGRAWDPEPGADARSQRMFQRHVATAIVAASRKSVGHVGIYEAFRADDPSMASKESIDDWLTRVTLPHITEWVRRYCRLKEIIGERLLPLPVAGVLDEASGCFIRGLDAAAATVCRTALEVALEDRTGEQVSELVRKGGNDHLNRLIEWARTAGLLAPRLVAPAHKVRVAGNRAAHTGKCSEAAALASLDATKDILAHLYGRVARRSG